MTNEEKLIKIFDRLRPEGSEHMGVARCNQVNCSECPFKEFAHCVELVETLAKFRYTANDILRFAKILDEESKKMTDILLHTSDQNPCLLCDCYDSDTESCTMPSSDRLYACPLEDDEYIDEENNSNEK